MEDEMIERVANDPSNDIKSKKFKQYFFEGIMIFIAITLGFFADNLRDAIGERNKADEYVITMRNNLVKDTIKLDGLISYYTRKIQLNDTLFHLLNQSHETIDRATYYATIRSLTASVFFQISGSAPNEFRSADLISILEDEKLFQMTIKYDSLFSDYRTLLELEQSYQLIYMQNLYKVTESEILRDTYSFKIDGYNFPAPKIPMGTGIPEFNTNLINEFKGILTSMRLVSLSNIYEFDCIKKGAKETIEHIDEFYNKDQINKL